MLALLVFCDSFEQMHTAEIGPERRGHVNLGIGEWPQQEITQSHLARGPYYQIRVGKMPSIEMPGYCILVDLQVIESAILRSRIHNRAERVYQFAAGTIIQRQRQHHA